MKSGMGGSVRRNRRVCKEGVWVDMVCLSDLKRDSYVSNFVVGFWGPRGTPLHPGRNPMNKNALVSRP